MYRNTCLLVAALAGIYAVAYTLAPQLTASFYMENANADTALMGRFFGLALVFMAMVCWLLKDSTSSDVQIAVSTAGIAGSLLGFITSIVFTLNGQMTAFTWGPVLIYLITNHQYFMVHLKKPGHCKPIGKSGGIVPWRSTHGAPNNPG